MPYVLFAAFLVYSDFTKKKEIAPEKDGEKGDGTEVRWSSLQILEYITHVKNKHEILLIFLMMNNMSVDDGNKNWF